MKSFTVGVLFASAIVLSGATFNVMLKETKLGKEKIQSYDQTAICLSEQKEVRCIGERTNYVDSEVMFYRCSDGYTAVTSPFTHVCEARRRDFVKEIAKAD